MAIHDTAHMVATKALPMGNHLGKAWSKMAAHLEPQENDQAMNVSCTSIYIFINHISAKYQQINENQSTHELMN